MSGNQLIHIEQEIKSPIVLHKFLISQIFIYSPYHQALEAIRQRHYEEVIPLIENDLVVQQSDPDHVNATPILRDYILQARFALMKENVVVSTIFYIYRMLMISILRPFLFPVARYSSHQV